MTATASARLETTFATTAWNTGILSPFASASSSPTTVSTALPVGLPTADVCSHTRPKADVPTPVASPGAVTAGSRRCAADNTHRELDVAFPESDVVRSALFAATSAAVFVAAAAANAVGTGARPEAHLHDGHDGHDGHDNLVNHNRGQGNLPVAKKTRHKRQSSTNSRGRRQKRTHSNRIADGSGSDSDGGNGFGLCHCPRVQLESKQGDLPSSSMPWRGSTARPASRRSSPSSATARPLSASREQSNGGNNNHRIASSSSPIRLPYSGTTPRHRRRRDEPFQTRDMVFAAQGSSDNSYRGPGDSNNADNTGPATTDTMGATRHDGDGSTPEGTIIAAGDNQSTERQTADSRTLQAQAQMQAQPQEQAQTQGHEQEQEQAQAQARSRPRSLGVHNILNPAADVAVAVNQGRPRDAGVPPLPLPQTRPGSASSPPVGGSHGQTQPLVPTLVHGPMSGPLPAVSVRQRQYSYGGSSSVASPATMTSTAQLAAVAVSLSGGPASGHAVPGVPGASTGRVHGRETDSPPLAKPGLMLQPAPPPARRILTPKSPRRPSQTRSTSSSAVLGQGSTAGSADTPPVPPIPARLLPQSVSAPNLGPTTPPLQSPQTSYAGPAPGIPIPPLPPPPLAAQGLLSGPPHGTPPSSFSQPFFLSGTHETEQAQGQRRSFSPQERQSLLFASRPQTLRDMPQGGYGVSPHTHHAFAATGGGGSGGSGGDIAAPWPPSDASAVGGGARGSVSGAGATNNSSGGSGGSGVGETGRVISTADGQQYITITPSVGDEIHVPVDVHQASRQADEKRLRNAGASARFRARKKEKDREVQMGMQRLETQNRDQLRRIQELEAERDFYRDERNRLRHAIAQHPLLRDVLEAAPPSPMSATAPQPPMRRPAPYPTEGTAIRPSTQQQQPTHHQQTHQQATHQQHLHHHYPKSPSLPPLYSSSGLSAPPPPPRPPTSTGYMSPAMAIDIRPSVDPRPARRRRMDAGPHGSMGSVDHHMAAVSSSLTPPLPHAVRTPGGGSTNMSPSPLGGSPNLARLPPLPPPFRVETSGAGGSSAGGSSVGGSSTGGSILARTSLTPEPIPGVSSLPAPQPYPAQPTTYPRSMAGWAVEPSQPQTSYGTDPGNTQNALNLGPYHSGPR